MPNHYAGDLRRTLAISGLSHVRTELPHLLVIPFLTPHPVESNREFPRHDYLGDPSLSSHGQVEKPAPPVGVSADRLAAPVSPPGDRKSTRLNSSHLVISYAVFCLKKKTKTVIK